MASVLKRIANKVSGAATVVTRTAANPLFPITDKIIGNVVPGYGKTVNRLVYQTTNPTSPINQAVIKAAGSTLNPFNNPITTAKNLNSDLKKAVVPNRSGYASSASASGAANATTENTTGYEIGKRTGYKIPNRAAYSAAAGSTESARQYTKAAFDIKKDAQNRGDAWNTAAANSAGNKAAQEQKDSSTPVSDAQQIEYIYPEDTNTMRQAANATGVSSMYEQQLPTVYIESDYKKYFIFGGIALAALLIWKKM